MSDRPELSVAEDHETLSILHLAAQMLGKLRVAHAPWMNHGWHVALQPNARGLSTLPTAASGGRTFTLTLDLCRHAVVLWISDGGREEVPLNAGSIAALHGRFDETFGEYVLPYAEVRAAADPVSMLNQFFASAYAAGADLAGWDRAALEREPVAP